MSTIDIRDYEFRTTKSCITFGDGNSTASYYAATDFVKKDNSWQLVNEMGQDQCHIERKAHAKDMIKALQYLIDNDLLLDE